MLLIVHWYTLKLTFARPDETLPVYSLVKRRFCNQIPILKKRIILQLNKFYLKKRRGILREVGGPCNQSMDYHVNLHVSNRLKSLVVGIKLMSLE